MFAGHARTGELTGAVITATKAHKGTGQVASRWMSNPFSVSLLITVMELSFLVFLVSFTETHFHIAQALDKMEAGQHMSQPVSMETGDTGTPICDTKACPDSEEDAEVITKKDEVESEGELGQFPTMLSDTVSSHDVPCEEGVDSEGEPPFCQQTEDSGDEGTSEDSVSVSGDCGASSPERMLQESVERLKTLMETHMWRERRTGGAQSALHN